jgi:hypothetical protein
MESEKTRNEEEEDRIKGSTKVDEKFFYSIVDFVAKKICEEDRPHEYIMKGAVYSVKEFGKRFNYQIVVN